MKEKKRKIINTVVWLLIAGGIALAARPGIEFFQKLLAQETENEQLTWVAATIIYALIAIVLLAVVSGAFAVLRGPAAGTALLMIAAVGVCGYAIYASVTNMPVTPEEAPGTPRPTITPPQVEIVTTTRKDENPETGYEFFRRYSNEDGLLTIDNRSQSDLYICMVDRHGVLVLIFYVRAGEECTLTTPKGTYELIMATGKYWEGEETYFGEGTIYRRMPEQYSMDRGKSINIKLTVGLKETVKLKDKNLYY